VIGGVASGVGKTSVAIGLMAALRDAGQRVGAAKVGPDYIDPSLHALAIGGPSYQLDAVMTGPEGLLRSAARAARGHELVVVEGVMGLFDGTDAVDWSTGLPAGSTAEAALLLNAPVVLVVDAQGLSHSVAALVRGFADHDPRVRVAGVICNRVASDRHRELLASALAAAGIPMLGAIPRGGLPPRRSRNLGLVDAAADPTEARAWVAELGARIAAHLDLGTIVALAAPMPAHEATPSRPAPVATLAYSTGSSASFAYPENLERLAEAGLELVAFDPRSDPVPPRAHALWLHGGYPELFADELAANLPMREGLIEARRRLVPIVAECGGFALLGRSLAGWPMAGILPHETTMTDRLTLGYRVATPRMPVASVLFKEPVVGHEFHRLGATTPGSDLLLGPAPTPLVGGVARGTLLASFVHWHLGGAPALLGRLVAAARLAATHASS
jgi:cobyrinic acid a,c-diamide synthase